MFEKSVCLHGKQTTEIFCAKINSTRRNVLIWNKRGMEPVCVNKK